MPKTEPCHKDPLGLGHASLSSISSPGIVSSSFFGLEAHRRCQNCTALHGETITKNYRDCFLLTIRRAGRSVSMSLGAGTSAYRLQLPRDQTLLDNIRDRIWEAFESVKVENDLERKDIEENKEDFEKGIQKARAPIPWLSYHTPKGCRGQTRSRDNFRSIWHNVVSDVEFWLDRDMWFTTTLLPSDFDITSKNGEGELEDGEISHQASRGDKGLEAYSNSAGGRSHRGNRSTDSQQSFQHPP